MDWTRCFETCVVSEVLYRVVLRFEFVVDDYGLSMCTCVVPALRSVELSPRKASLSVEPAQIPQQHSYTRTKKNQQQQHSPRLLYLATGIPSLPQPLSGSPACLPDHTLRRKPAMREQEKGV